MQCGVPGGRDENIFSTAVEDGFDACAVRREDCLRAGVDVNPVSLFRRTQKQKSGTFS